jgi:hypothetical protein
MRASASPFAFIRQGERAEGASEATQKPSKPMASEPNPRLKSRLKSPHSTTKTNNFLDYLY